MRLAVSLITIDLLLFLTNGIGVIGEMNIWAAFIISSLLSISAFVTSVIACYRHRSVWAFVAVGMSLLLMAITIFVFLLPEAGIPPAITF